MKHNKNATRLIHAGRTSRYCQGVVNPVVQRGSSVVFDSIAAQQFATEHRCEKTLFYGRRGTLTHFSLQDVMCELEGGAGCYLFACGAAAIANTLLAFLQTGDHLLMTEAAYDPTQDFCNEVLSGLGVETRYFSPTIGADISALIQPNTRVVFLESPSSMTFEVMDVPAMVAAIRHVSPDMIVVMDNTWAAGLLFPALSYGVDISIQAGTKYLNGHSDGMVGTAVANERCWPQLQARCYLLGQMLDADSAYLTSRGLRTLALRLQQHDESSRIVARWLMAHDKVEKVLHPALEGCSGHEFFQRDFEGGSGLFSFVLKVRLSDQQLSDFVDNMQWFSMAYSWGGYESLIMPVQPESLMRPVSGKTFNATLIRLHIGLENVDDLIDDLAAGLARI